MNNTKANKTPQLLTLLLSLAISSNIYADVVPLGVPDIVSAQKDTTITIDVLANDEGTDLTLVAPNVWSNKGGSVALVDNQLSYTPKADFVGEDKIWYVFADPQGLESFSEVTITVSEDATTNSDGTVDTTGIIVIEDPIMMNNESTQTDTVESAIPLGIPDIVSVVKNTTITVDVLANDEGNDLILEAPNAFSQQGGDVVLIDNQISYIPKTDFVGEDKIWYIFADPQGLKSFSEISITVTEDAVETVETVEEETKEPAVVDTVLTASSQANPDTVITVKNTTITIPVLMNDEGSGLTLTEPNVWSQQGGNVAMMNNQLSYMPKTDFVGEDKIWYVITDSQGKESFSVVTITVTDPLVTVDVTKDVSEDVTTPDSTSTSGETVETDESIVVVDQVSNVIYSNDGTKKSSGGGGSLDLLLMMLFGGLLLARSKAFKLAKKC